MLLAFGQSPAVLTERLVLGRALVGRDPRGGGERDSSGAVVPLGARSLRAVVYLGHELLVGYLWCCVIGGGVGPACGVGAFPNPLCAVEGRNWVASSGLAVAGWPGACPGLFPPCLVGVGRRALVAVWARRRLTLPLLRSHLLKTRWIGATGAVMGAVASLLRPWTWAPSVTRHRQAGRGRRPARLGRLRGGTRCWPSC